MYHMRSSQLMLHMLTIWSSTISHLHGHDVLGAWFVYIDETPGPRGTGRLTLLPAARTICVRIRSMLRGDVYRPLGRVLVSWFRSWAR
jgi:hypothetical protein